MRDIARRVRGRAHDNDAADVWLIVGLGNPGRRYHATRHNVGFMTIDRLSRRLTPGVERNRFQTSLVETRDCDRRVLLAKPQTFMNDSGSAVAELAQWHKIPLDRILVVYDDLDLPFGALRLRPDGSDGGHNGMASIIQRLRSQEFPRLRVGISRPATGATVPYVLSPFSATEQKELPRVLDRAADAALSWLRAGIEAAMNEHNRRLSDASDRPQAPPSAQSNTRSE